MVWVFLKEALYDLANSWLPNLGIVNLFIKNSFLELKWVSCILIWQPTCDQLIKCDTKGPYVSFLASDDSGLIWLEHLRGIKNDSANCVVKDVILLVFDDGTDPEIDKHSLQVVVQHDIVGLDVPVDHLNDVMAVVQRFEHVDEVQPNVVEAKTNPSPFVSFIFI